MNLTDLKRGMEIQNLDILLAVSQENFFYLTGSLNLSQKIIPDRLCIALLTRSGELSAVVCHSEAPQTRLDSKLIDIHTYLEFCKTPMRALSDLLKERGLAESRIGIEGRFLAALNLEELKVLLPKATLEPADFVFDGARAIKTPSEISILTGAATRTEEAIQAVWMAAKPGDTEKQIADDISFRAFSAGATSRWIVLAAGENTAINHPYPSSKPLVHGEIMRVDFGGVFGGYQSDVARTAVIGGPSVEQVSIYGRLREAQRETIYSVFPGMRACDLYAKCKKEMERRNLPFTLQAIGHGLGVALHEFPILNANETAEIESGMVLNIEPAVRDSEGFLYHLEDLFVVTQNGPKILTTVMDTEELFVVS